ncbi:unnamed protein product [Fusarium graminearum]|uniref:Chromosome 1, complete genome n=1 Tax=Gibberella zeae (strain ATCC MYA-4620 / CBS 123657 / FGSC 9075 / NRRL 31084 / PH-1) TaxID=229533 RepID=A0A098DDN2_GIBZE|nr:unnamed protein product [Fusarium graminearum]
MRSVLGLMTLVILGNFNAALASRCKPHPPSITTTKDVTMTANPTSSETEGPLIVKNKIAGGNFATRGTVGNPVPGFSVEGEAQILLNKGYTGDGSKEQGCVELSATGSPAGRKRAVGNAVRISQQVSDLNTKNKYTVRFFCAAITTISVNMCDISASIGNLELYMSNIISSRQVIQWATILTQTDVPHTEGTFLLSFTCPIGGIAIIYVDSIFMSNQVTPDNIDDVATNFGNEGGVPTPRTTTSPATASPTTETPNIQVTTGKPSTMDAPSSAAYDPTSDADQTAFVSLTHLEPAGPMESLKLMGSLDTSDFSPHTTHDFDKETLQQSSLQCVVICFQLDGCAASAYDDARRRCIFSNAAFAITVFQEAVDQSSAGFILAWSSLGCWSCSNDCSTKGDSTSETFSSAPLSATQISEHTTVVLSPTKPLTTFVSSYVPTAIESEIPQCTLALSDGCTPVKNYKQADCDQSGSFRNTFTLQDKEYL